MSSWFADYIKDPLQNGWNWTKRQTSSGWDKIKDAFKQDAVEQKHEDNQQPGFFKKVGSKALGGLKSIPGFFLGKGTIENLTTPGWKNKLKGLGQAALVLGAMIGIGLLTAGGGWVVATGFALAAGVATQKLATKLGSRGIEMDRKARSDNRINNLAENLTSKKKELEKSKGRFKGVSKKMGLLMKLGLAASVVAAIFAPPLLILPAIATLVGSGAKYFPDKAVAKKEAALKDFGSDNEMSQAKQVVLGLKYGVIKKKDLTEENLKKLGIAGITDEQIRAINAGQSVHEIMKGFEEAQPKMEVAAPQAQETKQQAVQAATASRHKESRQVFEAEDVLKTNKLLEERTAITTVQQNTAFKERLLAERKAGQNNQGNGRGGGAG